MNDRQIRLAQMLAFAGILPPWLCLGLQFGFGTPFAAFAALGYGAVIASFVCGMHWGLYLQRPDAPLNLLITSNVGALAAWGAMLAYQWSATLAFLALAGVLGLLLLVDGRLQAMSLISQWFWRVRLVATLGLGSGLLVWSVVA